MSDHTADFESHHIEGYARAALDRGADAHFDVPLISHITGNLWMGGCINNVQLPPDFHYVLSLYPWERYTLAPGTVRYEARLYDAAAVPAVDELDALGEIVCRELLVGKTLVHCQAGLNRSGLICALALHRQGRSARQAIALLREKRSPLVLCNETFERYLHSLDEPASAAA